MRRKLIWRNCPSQEYRASHWKHPEKRAYPLGDRAGRIDGTPSLSTPRIFGWVKKTKTRRAFLHLPCGILTWRIIGLLG